MLHKETHFYLKCIKEMYYLSIIYQCMAANYSTLHQVILSTETHNKKILFLQNKVSESIFRVFNLNNTDVLSQHMPVSGQINVY